MRRIAAGVAILVACGGSSSGSSDSSAVIVPAIVAQHTAEQLANAQRKTATLDCQQIVQAAQLFFAEQGRWPTSVEALADAKVLPRVLRDPWDGAFELRVEADELHVRSAGPDRKLDTDDDLRCGD